MDLAPEGRRVLRRGLRRFGVVVHRLPCPSDKATHTIRTLQAYSVDSVLDVGANCGQYAAWLREAGYSGVIESFEPVSEAYEELSRRAASDPLWRVHRLALGDRPGSLTLNVAESSDVSSFLQPTDEWTRTGGAGAQVVRQEEVSVTTLDHLAPEIPYQRIFLKIDTQGYDLKVLAGATSLLRRSVVLQLELSVIPIYREMPSYIEALTTVQAIGFTPTGVYPVTMDRMLRVVEFDGLFVRAPS